MSLPFLSLDSVQFLSPKYLYFAKAAPMVWDFNRSRVAAWITPTKPSRFTSAPRVGAPPPDGRGFAASRALSPSLFAQPAARRQKSTRGQDFRMSSTPSRCVLSRRGGTAGGSAEVPATRWPEQDAHPPGSAYGEDARRVH